MAENDGLTFKIASKANAFGHSGKSLSKEKVRYQLEKSLSNLKIEQLDLFYLHGPDRKVDIVETLQACNDLYQEKKFKEFGLSNFSAWEVVDIWHLCDKNGWVKPTVYQGMYNAFTRDVEKELFPALRKFGIRFYAYNPLAGGLLTGKYLTLSSSDVPTEGRFALRKHYLNRFWKQSFFDSTEKLAEECKKEGIEITESAFRWLMFHSKLDGECGDKIIIGASSLSHFSDNISIISNATPLPQSVVECFEHGWELASSDCPSYFHPF